LTSLDGLAGLRCAGGGTAGAVSIAYDPGGRVTLTCVPDGGGGGTALRINEFSVGTAASLADEFVELFNPGTTSADIGGYRLVYRSGSGTSDVALVTIPAGTTLAPGAFYLVGGASYGGAAPADQSFAPGLASTAGALALRDDEGAIVDSVGYGTASNIFVEGSPAPAPPVTAVPGSSAARSPDGHDTNDNARDFTVITATPRAPNR
jgi:hypothetical protein